MNSIKLRFTGEYSNSLDLKNRVNIPAKFRKALDPINDRTFVITRGFDPCLALYPLAEWNIVEQQLASLSSIRNKLLFALAFSDFLFLTISLLN